MKSKMNMKFVLLVLYWLFLNVMVNIACQLAFFLQTTLKPGTSIYEKLLTSEFWATIEWLFLIPSQRMGIAFLNPAQLAMSSYVFGFLAQIISNEFWLNIYTSIDDYMGMLLILVGMGLSKMRAFG